MRGGGIIHSVNYQKCYISLIQNLSPLFTQNTPQDFFNGKMETFLTCRRLIEHLREKISDKDVGDCLEEITLNAIYETLQTNPSLADIRLLFSELPYILRLKYPVVSEIRKLCINFVPHLMNLFRMNGLWRAFNEMYYFGEILKTFDSYEYK